MRIARSLGLTLRRFHGRDDDTGPEVDAWERALWRAFDAWESDRCPDCGQPLSQSLWDPDIPESQRAKWRAIYHQCRACLELENAQSKQAELDRQKQKQLGKDAPPIPHRYRKWSVGRDDERGR